MKRRTVSLKYRTTLFKRKLREIIGAPWLRFRSAKGPGHMIIWLGDFMDKDRDKVAPLLKSARIEFEAKCLFDWDDPKRPTYLTIPIDQEALPETAAQVRYAFEEEAS